jgi:hypothetical protein
MEPLTLDEIKLVNKVEQYWHIKREFPPEDFFDNKLILNKPAFKRAMSMRGILMPSPDNDLSSEQMAAILVITNYLDKRSQAAKLKSLGVTPQQWQGWLKDHKFKTYLHNISSSTFEDALPTAYEGLLKKVEAGDVNAVKFYMEVTGRYTEDAGQVQNLKIIVARLIEVIQRRVKDPELLRAISSDFNTVLTGGEAVVHEAVQIERVI